MRASVALLWLCCAAWAFGAACRPDPGTGDGDADTDADADAADGGQGSDACPPEAECCEDRECSNGVFCDGLEVCDRGRCEPGLPTSCDDGRACTDDSCDELSNLCVHQPRHAACDDGDLCNGEERCEPNGAAADRDGCVRGRPLVCDDGDPCTEDFCEANECRVALKDADDDGYGDDRCALCDPADPTDCVRGDDCDDADPSTYPGAPEICDDGRDNNCDRVRDYADPACTVPNDTCATALPLARGALVHSSLRRTAANIESGCAPAAHRDVAFSFTIATVQDLEVHLDGGGQLSVALTPECGNASADLRCTTGRSFTQSTRALEAGTYYVVVSGESEVDFVIRLEHHDPVPRPAGDQCATAPDISAGGTFVATTVDFDADYESRCGSATDLDTTYTFTLTEPRAVDIGVVPGSGPVSGALQRACGVVATERGCFTATAPIDRHYRLLEAGTWFLVFKTPGPDEFEFTVSFGPAEVGVALNFVALPYDFYAWDDAASRVLYRAVTYGFGSEPVVGAVQECADTTGATSSTNPGGPYAGEYNATVGALTWRGYSRAAILDLVDHADAAARLGTYDVLLFMEMERCTPSAASWLPTVEAHLAAGGRVVTMAGSNTISFVNGLGLFGTGSSGTATAPYTTEPHDFWDGGLTMSAYLNATWAWRWTGPYLVPLSRSAAAGDNLMVFAYEVP